ncbi:gag-pol polyprotein [Tanacetum coccineum]
MPQVHTSKPNGKHMEIYPECGPTTSPYYTDPPLLSLLLPRSVLDTSSQPQSNKHCKGIGIYVEMLMQRSVGHSTKEVKNCLIYMNAFPVQFGTYQFHDYFVAFPQACFPPTNIPAPDFPPTQGLMLRARGKKVICYNCRGEGHVARQCKEPKRKMDSQYFKDKALLMEAKEKGDVLDAEAEAFLADVECTAPYDQPQALTTTNMFQANHEDAYDSDVDEGPNAAVAFMANLSSTSATNNPVNEEEHLDSDAETEIDDNTIPYHQYLLDTEAQNVPTEVSADTSDKVPLKYCDQQALETDKCQLKLTNTSLRNFQLDGLKVRKLECLKRRYDEAVNGEYSHTYCIHCKASAFTTDNPKAESQVTGSNNIPPPNKRANWVKHQPPRVIPKKKQVTFSEPPRPSLKPTQKPVVHPNKQTNVCVPMSTGVKPTSGASKTVPKRAPRNHSSLPVKSANARKVEAHIGLEKKESCWILIAFKHSSFCFNLNNVCGACNKSLVFANHTDCLVMCDGSVNVKPHQTKRFKRQPRKEWKPVKRVWKPISKPVANSKPQWKPTGRHFSLFEKYPLN